MTAHTHATLVEGCFRCELSKDEMDAISAEQDAVLAALMRRMLEQKILRPNVIRRSLDLAMANPVPLLNISEDEWEILTDVQDFDEVPT